MAIKILWTLEGTEKILSDQEKVAKKGEEVGKRLGDIGKGGVGVDKLVKDLQGAGLSFDQASDKSLKFGTALKALSGALRLVGVDIEGLGAAGALLNKTLVGAGVAIAGGIVVALGKLEETAARTLGQLSDTFGSTEKGQQAFAALQKSAQAFGSSVGELAPGLTALQTALNNVDRAAKGFVALRAEDLPGGSLQNVQRTTEVYNNFIKILRAGRVTQDEAQKSAEAFFKTFADGGNITSAALKQLPIGTIKLLQEALGAVGLKTKDFFAALDAGAIPFERFAAALAQFGPQAQKAFDTKAIRTMGDALGEVIADLETRFTRLAGINFSQAVINQLDGIRKGANDAAQEIEDLINAEARLRAQALERLIQPKIPTAEVPLPRARPEDIDKVKTGFIDLTRTVQQLGADGFNAGQKIAQGMNQVAQATAVAQERFDEFGNSIEEAGRGGEAFKGRLNQIPIFVAQLAGQGGPAQQAGKEAGKQWVQAAESEIKGEFQTFELPLPKLEIIVPPEAQQQLVNQFATTGGEAGRKASESINQGITETPLDLSSYITSFQSMADQIAAQASALWQRVQQILSQPIQFNIGSGGFTGPGGTFTGGGFGEFLAGGGQVRGPGSTTSDSILARLSNREWVINAKAVDFYGSNLFAALNSMRLPRHAALPKFAEGGQATPSSSLTLVLGGRSFETSASEHTVTALRRFAVHSQLASIGRKPGFVR